jgi:putative transposase
MLRRHKQLAFAGSLHFVTTVTEVRSDWFVDPALCRKVLEAFEYCRARFEVQCLGYVLMPDHLHAVLYQQNEEALIPAMMRRFKSLTATRCRPHGYENTALWRRRYDDVPLPNAEAVNTRLQYMHFNPVRRGLVEAAEKYAWSSARDWAGTEAGIVHISKELM